MKKFTSIILMWLAFTIAYAQKTTITGTIVNLESKELAGITIRLLNTAFSTSTNAAGEFSFQNIPDGTYALQASGVGFSAQKQNVLVAGRALHIALQLDDATNSLQEVLITANRKVTDESSAITRINTPVKDLPQSIQNVELQTIKEQQLFTVDQALKNVAGVNAATFGSVNIRGFATNNRSFLTNGLKGSPYPEGVQPLLGNIERIEVIRGSSALLYGEGALGGNINLVTKQPKKEETANASLGAGTFNLYRALADVTGSFNKSKSLYFLAGAAYQNGGRFTRNFDNENLQIYGSLKWELGSKTTWQINGNYTRDRSTSNWEPAIPVFNGNPRLFTLPIDFTAEGPDSRYAGNSYQIQSFLEHQFSQKWKGTLLFGLSESRARRKQYNTYAVDTVTNEARRTFSQQELNSPTTTINPYVNGEFNFLGIKNKLVSGLDITFSRSKYPSGIQLTAAKPINTLQPNYSTFDSTGAAVYLDSRTELFTNNTAAGYILNQITFSPKIKALVGLRYTNYFFRYLAINDEDGLPLYDERPEVTESFTPRAGLVYQPFTTTSFYLDYNRGFIPQYSNERQFGGPFNPEMSRQLELGFKGDYLKNRLHPTVAVYNILKKNVLIYYEDEALPAGYGYKPLEQVRSKGVELGITGNITKELFLIANYSYNETTISKSNDPEQIGQTFYNSPNHLANGWLSYSFTGNQLKGLQLGLGWNYVGERDAYFGKVPAYQTADALIGYRYKSFGLQLNGNNLFDKVYAQNAGYSDYTPGMPRNFLLTLSYSAK
jgi:iron complex outermembrane receptor protein